MTPVIELTRLRIWLGLAAPFILLANSALAQTVTGSVREGNELFSKGHYEEALKRYQAAQVESPADERLDFNIGDAQYRLGSYNDALSEFQLATQSSDSKVRARSHYNAGNALYRMGRLEEAVEQYLKTLEIDPNDEDARFNLEFVRREIERRQKDQQQRQEEQQNKKKEEEEGGRGGEQTFQQSEEQKKAKPSVKQDGPQREKDKQFGQQPEESPEKEASNQTQLDEMQPGTGEQAEEQPSPALQEGTMSRENVERWLDMIEAESADNMKEFLRQRSPREPAGYSEDW